MLSVAPGVGYVHEPFNPAMRISANPKPFPLWFERVEEGNDSRFHQVFQDVLEFKYPLFANLLKARTPRDFGKTVRDVGLSRRYRLGGYRPLIKDPIAIFSAEWLHTQFDMDIVVMIRHPAAFCSSLKIKGWEFDFNDFLAQPILMETYLKDFRNDIGEFAKARKPLLDQAILLWNCIHQTIAGYRDRHEDWRFIRHEDISSDPQRYFKETYNSLDLEFTPAAESAISGSSGSENPSDPQSGNQFRRDSIGNITNWKSRLTEVEVRRVREGTSDLSPSFYSDSDW